MSKIDTVKKAGARFYVNEARPNVTVPGVTSIVGMLPKQDFLGPWQANMAADLAIDSFEYLRQMAERDRAGAKRYIAGAARRYTEVRSKLGSRAHDVFERLMNGEEVDYVHSDIVNHVEHFRQFLAAVNPELVRAEDVAWSYEHEYAGSFDAILRIWVEVLPSGKLRITPDRSGTPILVMVDYKTSKSIHSDVALQLAAYRYADVIIDPEGNETPMPEIDSAAVLHITDDQWTFKGVRADRAVHASFLTLRETFRWVREDSKDVVGLALASSKSRMVTGTERRGK
ncbi:PD-(D/E)XK nuclease family protein [Streptomyces cylindrosporus]|uniref:PD-(D/E)XK nuclease family protein n=1 Tax=Streptomyces cylindrosporus TaxID=2927583 RepID=A0ABS9Y518_9ACTN|nr:PD-(D/E)XK nuclease family protein [Streptomyces cylindrosporus]MCI3271036.1 PD-(D/E)XK nuclease family protein [Streptomyces cylindrosporus]